jgi:predicted molibdopterin-dependent oxidoreductase YjgC
MITPDRIVPTTCPYCGVGCSLELHIKDDYIYKVTSPFDGVVNHGNLCVKGRFGYDFVYNKDRVTAPLIRKTAQAPGARTQAFDRSEWHEVSWDEALDYTADRLTEIFKRHGPDALAEAIPRSIPHQQRGSLHPFVPCGVGSRAANGDRILCDEQYGR